MKTKIIKGYKFVHTDLKSDSGDCQWRIGTWKKHDGELRLCYSGFHASPDLLSVLSYAFGDRLFEVEAKGEIIMDNRKDNFVARELRLKREIRLKLLMVDFSTRCAERVLPIFEKRFPNDYRPRQAIEAAKAWLQHPSKTAESAASADWSTADFAESAAQSAAWSVAFAARSAAWSAARPADSAARSAAWFAAESAESAARSAARSADWSAASAAWSAAWSAASAAWSAADSAAFATRSAVWSAASAAWSTRSDKKRWQKRILEEIVKKYYIKG